MGGQGGASRSPRRAPRGSEPSPQPDRSAADAHAPPGAVGHSLVARAYTSTFLPSTASGTTRDSSSRR